MPAPAVGVAADLLEELEGDADVMLVPLLVTGALELVADIVGFV